MEKICLDTDIALDFLRGEQNCVEKLKYYAAREEICISTLTLIYLLSTIRKQDVAHSFANSVTILDLTANSARLASRLIHELKEKGYSPKNIDNVLTAAICMSNNAFLITKDRTKFEGIKGLKLV